MPWKLVSFITVLVLITVFIGFNLENSCDVSFIFYTFKNVPIFISLLFAYVAGSVSVLPFFFGLRRNRTAKGIKQSGNGIKSANGKAPRNVRSPKAGREGHDYDIN